MLLNLFIIFQVTECVIIVITRKNLKILWLIFSSVFQILKANQKVINYLIIKPYFYLSLFPNGSGGLFCDNIDKGLTLDLDLTHFFTKWVLNDLSQIWVIYVDWESNKESPGSIETLLAYFTGFSPICISCKVVPLNLPSMIIPLTEMSSPSDHPQPPSKSYIGIRFLRLGVGEVESSP